MKLISPKLIIACLVLLFIFSCDVTQEIEDFKNVTPETETPVSEDPIDNLNIPSGFDFSTHKEVKVTINDTGDNVRYDIFVYSDEKEFVRIETYENEEGQMVTDSVFNSGILDKLIFNGVIKNGKITQTIAVPEHFDQLYIRRKNNLKYSSEVVTISNGEVNYFGSDSTSKVFGKSNNESDIFYCVNGNGELFQVDPFTGAYTLLCNMPMGSYTCAIDQENKLLYSIGRSRPNPLMKYSIENNSWETITDLEIGGPRLDFNEDDGMLYFSNWDKVYTINPSNGSITDTKDMDGALLGGDLVFAEDGTMYMCSFTGLYQVELDGDGVYQRTYISSTVPLNLTSMEFDSDGQLWLADAWFGNSDLMTVDLQTGSWQYVYGVSANNGTNFSRKINDLAILNAVEEVVEIPDADGDGIADYDDAFPNDPDRAFVAFTPSESGWGTFAFEDLWPHTGDYDFNDVALNYRFKAYLNAQNNIVQLDFSYYVKANGAGLVNGFGLEIESLTPGQIESVTGLDLKHGFVNIAGNGTESGQDNAVFVMFDDARSMLGREVTVSILLSQPVNPNSMEPAPFNPFIIVGKEREKEVHLPFKNPTSLGDNLPDVVGSNRDLDGNYVTESGLPWAINVAYDFKVPNERIQIIDAYNFFSNWASSGGSTNDDWYKDDPGNINSDKVSNN
ncbi:LruC domain-containing protein [Seonamhaeicola sp. MEBiC1930]|uniref:LruC domain-containing protein n=1 Tax=Seonamhaeicola sp. MEBiC01930 TaxID=2976768 RepID=UPI00325025C7